MSDSLFEKLASDEDWEKNEESDDEAKNEKRANIGFVQARQIRSPTGIRSLPALRLRTMKMKQSSSK